MHKGLDNIACCQVLHPLMTAVAVLPLLAAAGNVVEGMDGIMLQAQLSTSGRSPQEQWTMPAALGRVHTQAADCLLRTGQVHDWLLQGCHCLDRMPTSLLCPDLRPILHPQEHVGHSHILAA